MKVEWERYVRKVENHAHIAEKLPNLKRKQKNPARIMITSPDF